MTQFRGAENDKAAKEKGKEAECVARLYEAGKLRGSSEFDQQ